MISQVTDIYESIAQRTDGNIYIGVVGPVRTGKSTFIKRFMQTLVLPRMENGFRRDRATDELPQSGSGRTIMTAEPKFVPEEAAHIKLAGGAEFGVRLVDCVGYLIPGAMGQFEDLAPRMVMTPWFDHEIPMAEAAEIGTRKVISEHATVGIVITTDGTITEIPREDYLEAEDRAIRELQAIGKPFVVLVNSVEPGSPEAAAIAKELAAKYDAKCLPVNCLQLDERDPTDHSGASIRISPTGAGCFFPVVGRFTSEGAPHQKGTGGAGFQAGEQTHTYAADGGGLDQSWRPVTW